jgi:hypothetical protein
MADDARGGGGLAGNQPAYLLGKICEVVWCCLLFCD